MALDIRFRLNNPQVVSETVDGEAIIVNLDSGTYYSIKGDGILIWNAITEGATVAELVDAVVGQTQADADSVRSALDAFSDALAAQGLIVARADGGAAPSLDFSGAGSGLAQPSFESYSDMQDLILLDPVHEVDEAGWPHVQAGT
jgi:hypothetical protein